MLLANVADVFIRAIAVIQCPLGLMVDFKKSMLVVVILVWVLIEYQLRQVVLARNDELVCLGAIVARSSVALVIAKETGIL